MQPTAWLPTPQAAQKPYDDALRGKFPPTSEAIRPTVSTILSSHLRLGLASGLFPSTCSRISRLTSNLTLWSPVRLILQTQTDATTLSETLSISRVKLCHFAVRDGRAFDADLQDQPPPPPRGGQQLRVLADRGHWRFFQRPTLGWSVKTITLTFNAT